MPSTKVCCGCNIFALTKGFTLFEIGMSFVCLFQTINNLICGRSDVSPQRSPEVVLSKCVTVIAWLSYLFLELHGLKNFKHVIIVVGCIIRSLKTFTVLLMMILVPFFVEKLLEGEVELARYIEQNFISCSHLYYCSKSTYI